MDHSHSLSYATYLDIAFPPPDETIRGFFMAISARTWKLVAADMLVFFAALFNVVAEAWKDIPKSDGFSSGRWRDYLGTSNEQGIVRHTLYKKATDNAREALKGGEGIKDGSTAATVRIRFGLFLR